MGVKTVEIICFGMADFSWPVKSVTLVENVKESLKLLTLLFFHEMNNYKFTIRSKNFPYMEI